MRQWSLMRPKTTYPKVKISHVLHYMGKALYPDRWLAVGVVLLFLVASITEVFVPLIFKKFFDTLSTSTPGETGAAILVALIIQVLMLRAFRWASRNVALFGLQKIEPDTMARIREMSFEYMTGHSFAFFSNNFTGSLIQRVSRFARSFERLADAVVFHFIPLAVTITGAIIVTSFLQPLLAIIIAVWVVVFFTLNYIFALWRVKYNIELAAADSKTTGMLADLMSNQSAITLFTSLPIEAKRFSQVSTQQATITKKTWNVNSSFDAVQAAVIFIAEFFILYFSIGFWEAGVLTIGTFVLVQVYVIQLSSQLWDFGRIIRTVYEVFADSKEMVEILLLPHEIRDIPGAKELTVPKGSIEFKDLTLNFQKTRVVLDAVSLSIPGGQKIALVGPSGAGKTTIIKVLLRLYDVTGGHILIDGQDISGVTQESLRKNIALVPQDPILFHRTLIDNIRYGRPDATDEEVKEAARRAHCDEFIQLLPEGYGTYVGERGMKLSGGERQRIAIARALLKNAPILILDEATSSLDSQSEALIQDALDTLMKGKTAIVIAHRLSTIRQMDRIIVLQDGAIREDGTHDELMQNTDSLYKNLWSLQAGGFITDEEEK